MQPDDDSQTTLSKWPFVIGDVLLVATALAIAILSGWQLTNWQVGACVASVALGAALFVLPYVVEFQVRVREEREDRAADLRILEKHILSAEQMLDALDARTRALEAAAASSDDPNAAHAEAVDEKFAQLEAACRFQDEVTDALRANLDKLSKKISAEFDPKVLTPIEERLKALEERPEPPAEVALETAAKDETSLAGSVETKPAEGEKAHAVSAKKVAQIERPARTSRERHGPKEPRLLKRAISEKGGSSSTAVSRIIESRAQKKPPEPIAEQASEPEAKSEAAPKEVAPAETAKVKEPGVKVKGPEVSEKLEAHAPAPKAPEPAEKAETPEPQAPQPSEESPSVAAEAIQEKEEPVKNKPPAAKKPESKKDADPKSKEESAAPEQAQKPADEKPEATDEAPIEEGVDMLFDEAKITSPVTRTKAKKNDAVITASVFIGIGNKPYLRGGAGGLSWETGLAMEFQEIGKWRWVAPSDLDAALEVQIYRNDEDPDQSGKYTLEPGQKLEVMPVF